MRRITAGVLDVAYYDTGPVDGPTIILLHGFPYDVHAYDEAARLLTAAGCRCIVPFLRGFGPTRFLSRETPRSGEQAALGADLLALMDALSIPRAILGGYDWGGRAACIVAALWPERVHGLVSCGTAYNIQNIAAAGTPASPEEEWRYWYQYYFHTERGSAALSLKRHDFCRFLWRQWSPTWSFHDKTFKQTAVAFDNPDFVSVVIHSYRHRYGGVPGDPALGQLEARLGEMPVIAVPTVVLQGADDGVTPPKTTDRDAHYFSAAYQRRIVPDVGHNLPQEAPSIFAEAVLSVA